MASFFEDVPLEPPNSILGIALDCKNDPFPEKINLTIGAYRTETGEPCVLPCVRQAEEMILADHCDHEYLTQDGLAEFIASSKELMFGVDCPLIAEEKIYSIQAIAGTGALRLACTFLAAMMPGRACYMPDVTWPNHPALLKASGIAAKKYRYIDSSGVDFDFEGMLADLNEAPEKSIVLFHNCAHNPTGVDPTEHQWREILEVVKRRNLFPFFDNAYQGFVSGDPEMDAFAVRLFASAGCNMLCACSFSKNFGLYGERLGVVHVVASTADEAVRCASQLRNFARTLCSTCPTYGARVVAKILTNPEMKKAWANECKMMASRIAEVRQLLHDALVSLNAKGTWGHIVKQRGMFSYTGIPKEAVIRLRNEFHIYMLESGRISLAGLNKNNIPRMASAVVSILGTN